MAVEEAKATQILGIVISFLHIPLLHSLKFCRFLLGSYILLYLAGFLIFSLNICHFYIFPALLVIFQCLLERKTGQTLSFPSLQRKIERMQAERCREMERDGRKACCCYGSLLCFSPSARDYPCRALQDPVD